jgi:Tol biopolymer transport system component
MIVLPGCSAERVLAFASAPRDANGDPGDVGGSPLDAGQDRADVGGGGDDAAGGWTPFGTPQLIGGLRGDTDAVEDPSLTFEELELYFTSPSGGQNDIWVSRRTSATDPWGPSTLVAELSSAQNDEDPEVSVDGLVMYFTSDRGGDGRRVYSSQRRTRDIPWETPVRVSDLGSSTLDQAPALDRAQLYLVFSSERGAATVPHLFSTARQPGAAWQNPTAISALTSAFEDTDPALFADGRAMLFASRRLTQGGTSDLFQAARSDASLPFASSLAPVTELDTDASEEDPWVSQNGRHVLFVSDRSGRKRIYEAWR